ncbi:hypothetical protein [Nocardioides sp. T2.26MG-1]|uniref:hypothetical protein n=1 Tax=Nocardioides sp. T2.26MG-1 TaxID=3041166 RepID=UPI00247786E7|nr:hypothetical protein [Nocardioides sp. T2.26MG-1]CAI9399190.1 hypothetical protein HIDPHFAB_00144 [Nocardioides sp. T2.26MG-1]
MRTARLPALGLFLVAPVCAEYLWGYDDSTGHPATLLGNLIVFSPLYGAPALLIREAARRLGLGWPGLLLLAAAFGVVEAGVVDQSMWSTDYRDIPYWTDMAAPTYLAPIGLSVYLAVSFVGGHVILSIGSPVVLVETLTGRRRHLPWLGPVALVVVALLYAAACGLVAKDAYDTGEATATWGQLAGSSAVAAGLVVAAVTLGRRPGLIVPGPVPRPALVAGAAGLAMLGWVAIPPTRLGTAAVVLLALGAIGTVQALSRRGDWGRRHELALASGALVAAGAFAFLTTPIGDVSDAEKYGHNVALLTLVVLLCAAASRRAGRAGPGRAVVPA